jgi:nicotinamide mononucleotide (NMN) deamidase PncC
VNAKLCSFDGCSSNAKKGGVCYRHRSKSGIITLTTNPVLQSNAIPPSVPNEIDTW